MCSPINKEYLAYMDYMELADHQDADNMNDDIDEYHNDIDDDDDNNDDTDSNDDDN